jgi:hypothetical protein
MGGQAIWTDQAPGIVIGPSLDCELQGDKMT